MTKSLVLTPHPEAVNLNKIIESESLESLGLVVEQVINGIQSDSSQSEELRTYLRELTLCSLWFGLKYVAGFAGPFDSLDEDTDVDSCNFYQKNDKPGARCAVFMPRGHYKSTIFTTGASWWDLLRNPELNLCIANAKEQNAKEFMHVVQRSFDSNELLWWLFPEYDVAYSSLGRWNDNEAVLPTRRKYAKEPNLGVISVGGASEGNHFHKLRLDDVIGLKALTADRSSGAEMYRTVNWMSTSQYTLLKSVAQDQVWIIGTRYGVDDAYSSVASSIKCIEGYPGRYVVNEEDPIWTLYTREATENGKPIKPNVIDEKGLEQLSKDDWWTYVTQYRNNPEESGMNEFNSYDVRSAEMDYDRQNGWMLAYRANNEWVEIPLSSCDVVQGVDPAATEKYVNARTSRSAVAVWAQDSVGNYFLISARVGYVGANELIDWAFQMKKKFKGALRMTCLETNAGFKMLGPLIRDEEIRRKQPINLRPTPAIGDKDARIRTVFEPLLAQGRVFVVDGQGEEFLMEKNTFPQSRTKDLLDASAHAISELYRPVSEEERFERMERKDRFLSGRNQITGY